MPPESTDPAASDRVNECLVPLLSSARVCVVAGKGGVGKTTVTAVLATAAAAAGMRVLAVELEGKPALGRLLDGRCAVLEVTAPVALEEYLRDHGFGTIARRLTATGVIEVVSTAAPGIDDIVVLGRIKQLERTGEWDVIVVDGPAAGHAVTMLTAAAGLRDAVRGGPVRTQADAVLALLHDAARCQVVLVTLPETTPVNETIETAFSLEDRVGVRLGPVIVNGLDRGDAALDPNAVTDVDVDDSDVLAAAARFRRARREMEAAAVAQLASALPLRQYHVPAAGPALGPATIAELAAAVRPA